MIAHDAPHRVLARHLMISPVNIGGVAGEIWRKRGGQDTSRTPKPSQSRSFACVFAGASVGGRAAREQKSHNLAISHGTIAQKARKAAP
jgi:hypothetical protein